MARIIDLFTPGAELAKGLGTGLQQLAQHKIGELHQQKQASGLQALLGFSPQQAGALSQLPPEIQQLYIKQALEAPQQEAFAQALGQASSGAQQQPLQEGRQPSVQQKPGRLNSKQALEVAKLQQAERLAEKKATAREKELEKKEIREKFKFNKEYINKILEQDKAEQQNLHNLERLEELDKTGKLDTPGYVEFLKGIGLDIPALLNPESEEFQKIQQSFLKSAKQYFGSRISNFEVEQFLKTIPNLSQSPEGRKRVIAGLKYISRGATEYTKALKEALKENKGVPHEDLNIQVHDKIDSRLDKLAEKFREDLARPVPAGQNKYITALQAGAGKLAGRIPRAALGAGIGAIAAGPAGAALGGLAGLSGVSIKDVL